MKQFEKNHPNTVDQVVNEIIAELPLEARVSTANLDENEFRVVELTLERFIRDRLDKMDVAVNKKLMEDCLEKAGQSLDEVDAAAVILKVLWNRLRETHRLRVIK